MKWVLPGFEKETYKTEMERIGKKFKLGL
jgi:hypothetical protein